ncbi:TetR/AcrR family transcriptional regulator [Streptacidiphilus monticola]
MASQETRRALIAGAIATLREVGHAKASAREIAGRAGCNQALVFYHFGSVNGLLIAALDHVAEQRRARYQALVDDAKGLGGLAQAARQVFEEDLTAGHTAVLLELLAAAQTDPQLRPGRRTTAPLAEFAADAVRGTLLGRLLPADEVAHAVVAMYLGLELLAAVDGDPAPHVHCSTDSTRQGPPGGVRDPQTALVPALARLVRRRGSRAALAAGDPQLRALPRPGRPRGRRAPGPLPRTRHSFPGAVAGLGLPLLWVAAANAGGPGEACTPTDGGMTCTDQWSPWPWLAAGLLLTAAGIALSATRARKNPDTPGHVHTPHP